MKRNFAPNGASGPRGGPLGLRVSLRETRSGKSHGACWLLIGILLTSLSPLLAQEPTFELAYSSPSVQLGDTVTLQVTAKAAQPLSLDLAGSTTDFFRIADARDLGAQKFAVDIVPLAMGKLPIVLKWNYAGGTMTSPPAVLEVAEPPMEKDAQLRDIKEPRAARPALWPWLLLAALIAAAYFAYKRRRLKEQGVLDESAPKDDRPPHVRAETELDELEASPLWSEGRYKDFYIRLTDILRDYLDGRFGLPAQRLTTTELARQMRQAELDRQAALQVKQVFDRADLVKFAKIAPEPGDGGLDIEQARTIVRETQPAEPVPAQP